MYSDQICLTPAGSQDCNNFQFLALSRADGLEQEDGVLGLAVHQEREKRDINFVWHLKNSGSISQAIVSFSVVGAGQSGESYALFGGIEFDQIVGGQRGLKQFKTVAYRQGGDEAKNWALAGENILYG